MADYKWVLCDNKINALNDIMNGLVDFNEGAYRIVDLIRDEVFYLDEYTIQELQNFVSNEDIKLFKKVVDTNK